MGLSKSTRIMILLGIDSAFFLLELVEARASSRHEGKGDGRIVVTLPFSKQMLAQKLGMQPESLSRAFGKLRRFGVQGAGQTQVVIGDPAGLRAFCQPESST